ncbi:PAS domain-containing sensor histidine kinase [Niastella vici]|uniref:histidine kinase n=1 Tax=Niastella vici TaxID=1703345 RepID=A0A1V9G0M1_9BACT|nr:ATP-binding protein [Niastella vici]OQP64078.1 PAS domain-containing sensor histidine kinase [Niastella vici]
MESNAKLTNGLSRELEDTRRQLYEALETIEALRTGQVDAIVVQNGSTHELYTLKTADHAYRVFIEKMTEGALTLSQEGIILFANSQFSEMTGLPLSAIIGLPFELFITKSDLSFYQQLFANSWKGYCKGEVEIVYQERRTPVQLSLTALELADGISLSVIITDLTLQKATQRKLQENNRQLEHLNKTLEASNHDLQQFASVASHDLQEPLRKIQMFSNFLKNNAGNLNMEQMAHLEKIIGSADRMKSLIIDILNYSRLSADDGEFSPTDLNIILKELLDDFELMIADKKAKVLYDNLPVLEVIRGQIRQVFQNLISNSLKFSKEDEPPIIKIKASYLASKSFTSPEKTAGPFCLLTIEDNGIGFEDKYAGIVFSLFQRLHSKDSFEGTGIGLAITKKIIEKHHGLIQVKSIVGKGTTFMIVLPLKQQLNGNTG